MYLKGPTRIVDETERLFRRRLDAPYPDMPLLEELRLAGATDYIMYPLPFLDHTRTAVISFATQRPQGFDPAMLDGLAPNPFSTALGRLVEPCRWKALVAPYLREKPTLGGTSMATIILWGFSGNTTDDI